MTTAFVFTLRYALAENDRNLDALEERLGEAGCDDALVGLGQAGRVALEFTRESEAAEAALHSALSDASSAMPGARLIEVAPDLLGLSDLAVILGRSRQYMRKLMLGQTETFPAAVHADTSSIWRERRAACQRKGRVRSRC